MKTLQYRLRIFYPFVVTGTLLGLSLLFICSCRPLEEKCFDEFEEAKVASATIKHSNSNSDFGTTRKTTINISLGAGSYIDFFCNLRSCSLTSLNYTVYAQSNNTESEETILQQGEIPTSESHPSFVNYDLIIDNAPSNSNFRLVLEGESLDCPRNDDLNNFQFEYSFSTSSAPPVFLKYDPNSITLSGPETTESRPPTIFGRMPMEFSIVNPTVDSTAIYINKENGQITATSDLVNVYGNGTYNLDVEVSNDDASRIFSSAFTFIVNTQSGGNLPSNLVYDPNSITQSSQASVSSVAPTVDGDTPLTFNIVNSNIPNSAISINANTGVITATDILALEFGNGSYTLDVRVTNATGSVTFENAYTINVSL